MEERVVLLMGCSLLLAGVAASLRECTDLRVVLTATWEEADALLADCTPQVMISDLADAWDRRVLTLLIKNPHLMLIGLDNEHDQSVLISGQQADALTMERLKEIVQESQVR